MTHFINDTTGKVYGSNADDTRPMSSQEFEDFKQSQLPSAEDIALQEAQAYLSKTDHKFYNGYKAKSSEDLIAIEALRDTARELIRNSEVVA